MLVSTFCQQGGHVRRTTCLSSNTTTCHVCAISLLFLSNSVSHTQHFSGISKSKLVLCLSALRASLRSFLRLVVFIFLILDIFMFFRADRSRASTQSATGKACPSETPPPPMGRAPRFRSRQTLVGHVPNEPLWLSSRSRATTWYQFWPEPASQQLYCAAWILGTPF